MSKYTTMVKDICESKFMYYRNTVPGAPASCAESLMDSLEPAIDSDGNTYYRLKQGLGGNAVDCILEYSWDKVFNANPPAEFYDPTQYPILCKKILKHYYMREIGCETAGLWVLWMTTRMDEIMPYYNKLYLSAQMQFDPFTDVNVTRHHTKGDNSHEDSSTTTRTANESDITDDTTYEQGTTDKFSDTPQGSISSPILDNYLTNARKTDISGSSSRISNQQDSQTRSEAGERSGTLNQVFDETITGKHGAGSYSSMLKEYRETILNIDLKVIKEFSDLFLLVW